MPQSQCGIGCQDECSRGVDHVTGIRVGANPGSGCVYITYPDLLR
jgi:hypothetical protein